MKRPTVAAHLRSIEEKLNGGARLARAQVCDASRTRRYATGQIRLLVRPTTRASDAPQRCPLLDGDAPAHHVLPNLRENHKGAQEEGGRGSGSGPRRRQQLRPLLPGVVVADLVLTRGLAATAADSDNERNSGK